MIQSVAMLRILAPWRSTDDTAEFRPVLAVVGEMLKSGFFACLREFENNILHLGKVNLAEANVTSKYL
jgi:hypothetical protein